MYVVLWKEDRRYGGDPYPDFFFYYIGIFFLFIMGASYEKKKCRRLDDSLILK
jgi:hypothetical protein